MRNLDAPLVSCIMPTYNRRRFIPNALKYFLRQDYPNKELIVLDDGTDPVEDLIPKADNIRYLRLPKKITLGAKLNLACEQAKGTIIANWDDDDWYAPWRLTYQMNTMKQPSIEVCGTNRLLYFDPENNKGFQYIYPDNQKIWLSGSTLCFQKNLWKHNRFAEINVGMDGLFVWATPSEKVKALENNRFAVHIIHPNNGSYKKTNGVWWHPLPVEDLRETVGADWSFYTGGNTTEKQPVVAIPQPKKQATKNVYACLVHEKPECILDLVKNLHNLDPLALIILYNGGNDPALLKDQSTYKAFGAVVCPSAKPQRYGYLHGFALDCMAFALEHHPFEVLTIVDSDQLCLRPGYADFITNFINQNPGVGLLSSAPERVLPRQSNNWVALQAYKEYDLWKPFLDTFKNGAEAFVHWTFWPSTVFTYAAARDLVKLFNTNTLLQTIVAKSNIWASEEVLFPTLVKLLGYKVLKNPCNLEYVTYKKEYALAHADRALATETAFWMHPVKRNFHDAVRTRVRNSTQTNSEVKTQEYSGIYPPAMDTILRRVQNLEGWLSPAEALLISTMVARATQSFPHTHTMVEVGCYQGKTSVLIGSILKHLSSPAKLYAMDAHDGWLGDAEQGLKKYPPSFNNCIANIHQAQLQGVVVPIKAVPSEVPWNQPIAFLVIDGLHDYTNVSKDFYHFETWLEKGGCVAFHDYAAYFPGVVRFVDGLLKTKTYRKVEKADSLIVLEKQ